MSKSRQRQDVIFCIKKEEHMNVMIFFYLKALMQWLKSVFLKNLKKRPNSPDGTVKKGHWRVT